MFIFFNRYHNLLLNNGFMLAFDSIVAAAKLNVIIQTAQRSEWVTWNTVCTERRATTLRNAKARKMRQKNSSAHTSKQQSCVSRYIGILTFHFISLFFSALLFILLLRSFAAMRCVFFVFSINQLLNTKHTHMFCYWGTNTFSRSWRKTTDERQRSERRRLRVRQWVHIFYSIE